MKKILNLMKASEFIRFVNDLGINMSQASIYFSITPRVLKLRMDAGYLNTRETERILRYICIYKTAIKVTGSKSDAKRWLESPAPDLGYEKPINLLLKKKDAKRVQELLGKNDSGVYI